MCGLVSYIVARCHGKFQVDGKTRLLTLHELNRYVDAILLDHQNKEAAISRCIESCLHHLHSLFLLILVIFFFFLAVFENRFTQASHHVREGQIKIQSDLFKKAEQYMYMMHS
jgi:hypothetical protein